MNYYQYNIILYEKSVCRERYSLYRGEIISINVITMYIYVRDSHYITVLIKCEEFLIKAIIFFIFKQFIYGRLKVVLYILSRLFYIQNFLF